MTMLAHPTYEHVAVFHDGPDDLARRLHPRVDAALAAGDAVLVCLAPDVWRRLAARLGEAAAGVTYLEPDHRYASPGRAMAAVNDFAHNAIERGARRVWSIGTLPFEGTEDDLRWVRYEAAVDDVLAHLPFHLVCTYDTSSMPAAMLDAARRTHAAIEESDGGRHESHDYAPREAARRAGRAQPPARPAVGLTVDTPASVRRHLDHVFATAPRDAVADLHLIATELVTNGIRHGGPPVEVRAWRTGDSAVVEVTDHGGGLKDTYPDLRPPGREAATRGYGLWLVGQLADRVEVEVLEPTTVVRATIRLDRD